MIALAEVKKDQNAKDEASLDLALQTLPDYTGDVD